MNTKLSPWHCAEQQNQYDFNNVKDPCLSDDYVCTKRHSFCVAIE